MGGTAYGFNPTSYVNPLPSMDTLTQGGLTDITGLPVPAAYVSAYPSWKDMSLMSVGISAGSETARGGASAGRVSGGGDLVWCWRWCQRRHQGRIAGPTTVTAWLQLLESYGMSIDESTLAIMIENNGKYAQAAT